MLGVIAGACDGGAAPALAPIDPATGRVNEELRIAIAIDNPSARPVALSLEGPMLPSFDRVTTLSTSPSGGTFTWVPLSSHVGSHELTFVLGAPGGGEYDRQSVLVTIEPAADAAPVFVRPGAGGTYDLTVSPCVTFDVEVRDDDSERVEIGTRSDPPAGATLANAGDKRATFDWCPTPDQVGASERWTIELFADDGDHPPVEHDYVVVLRSGPARSGCPGSPPVVTIRSPLMNERVVSGSTYPVRVTVTDDMGLRDPPLLYYTTTEPENPSAPDVTEFQLATFTDDGGGSFTARIPSLGLAEGMEAAVFYLVSATDNDDPSGSACDHRTDTELVRFIAVGGPRPDGSLAECEPCSASSECASGICAATAGGGRCVDSCSGSGVCDAGECGATVTTEGSTRAGCGPARDLCGSGTGSCADDPREPNDSIAAATPYTGPITDGRICAGNDDYFRISVPGGHRVTVTVDGFVHAAGDLDLELRSSTGTILGSSASVRDVESVNYCNAGAATSVYARVYGYGSSQNSYSLRADVAPDPGGCCTDDGFEEDDTQAEARSVSFVDDVAQFEGVVCGADDDWIAVPMSGPGRIEILVGFTHASGDVDLTLYGPTGVYVAGSYGVGDWESIDAMVSGGGTYALRIFAYGDGNPEGYVGEIRRTIGASCTSTSECPLDNVCAGGSCASDACASSGDCPAMHSCPETGPAGAPRHCASACTVNAQCRAGEACKWFVGGRGCGRTGRGANGDPCTSSADCGGQRTCLPWPGGYCARAGCTSNADCEPGTYCISEGGIHVCAVDCPTLDDDPCRYAEGHYCDWRPTLGGGWQWVCVP